MASAPVRILDATVPQLTSLGGIGLAKAKKLHAMIEQKKPGITFNDLAQASDTSIQRWRDWESDGSIIMPLQDLWDYRQFGQTLDGKCKSLEEKNAELSQELQDKTAVVESMQSQHSDFEARLSQQKQDLRIALEAAADQRLTDLQDQYQATVQRYEDTCEKLQSKVDTLLAPANLQHADQVQQIRKDFATEKQQLLDQISQLDDQLNTLESTAANDQSIASDEIRRLQTDNQEMLEDMHAERQGWSVQSDPAEQELRKVTAEQDRLRSELGTERTNWGAER